MIRLLQLDWELCYAGESSCASERFRPSGSLSLTVSSSSQLISGTGGYVCDVGSFGIHSLVLLVGREGEHCYSAVRVPYDQDPE